MSTQAQAPAPSESPVTAVAHVTPQVEPFDPMSFTIDKADNIFSKLEHGMVMQGNIRGSSGIIIRGTLDGDLMIEDDEAGKSGTVVVTETGIVRGVIHARRIIVQGTVDAVVCRAHLVVAKSAKILGHVFYDQMASEAGAEMEGIIRRLRPGMDPIGEIMASRARAANGEVRGGVHGALAANG